MGSGSQRRILGTSTTTQHLSAETRFICSHAFSEVLYAAHSSLASSGVIELSNLTAPFWSDVLDRDVDAKSTWEFGSMEYADALNGLWNLAERYLVLTMGHIARNGSMSEQIDR